MNKDKIKLIRNTNIISIIGIMIFIVLIFLEIPHKILGYEAYFNEKILIFTIVYFLSLILYLTNQMIKYNKKKEKIEDYFLTYLFSTLTFLVLIIYLESKLIYFTTYLVYLIILSYFKSKKH